MKRSFFLFLVSSFLVWWVSLANATSFQNGGFVTGDFTGWSGSLVDVDDNDTTVDPDTNDLFSIIPNAGPNNNNVAQVEVDDTYWSATLYQDFTLDSLLPGWTMDITFWIKWSPTNSSKDEVSATLGDSGGSVDLLSGIQTNDLLSGTWVTADITTFAQTYGGQDVELTFSLWDWDWDTSNTLQIDEISFRQHAPAPVPEPATALLFSLALPFLFMKKKAQSKE